MLKETKYNELTEQIIKVFFEVYNELGFVFLEKVYQNAMYIELKNRGFKVEAQKQIYPVNFIQALSQLYPTLKPSS
ncbi:GxxExxY protein [Runella sp. CRIBMP]|nr:GxxExxY protein [Runella sp. CRIBMP]